MINSFYYFNIFSKIEKVIFKLKDKIDLKRWLFIKNKKQQKHLLLIMNFMRILRPIYQKSRLISRNYSALPKYLGNTNELLNNVEEKINILPTSIVATKTTKQYCGPVKAAILDWSGTTLDKYVIAPAVVFVEVFKKFKVPITMEEARGPMGLRKDLHINALTESPEIAQRWEKQYGRAVTRSDIDAMFKEFVPLQLQCLHKYSTLLPNVVETIDTLRDDYDLKIGVTTGFTRVMVDLLLKDAKEQGFVPDCNVAGDEVLNGARPKPFMIYKNLDLLDVYPIRSVVKVDDTVGGIGEGQNAGCWTVGIARYSNYMNIDSYEHEASLSEEEIEKRLIHSRNTLEKAGADYVIDTLDQLPYVINAINITLRTQYPPIPPTSPLFDNFED